MYRVKENHVLGLRTVAANLKSYGGFQWPTAGTVTAPDWSPRAECGNGLHFLLWGGEDSTLLHDPRAATTVWQVVEVPADTIVALGGKHKAPTVEVVYSGDQITATSILVANAPNSTAVHYANVTAPTNGAATAGSYGTATAGRYGIATAGSYGIATAGFYGTATAGSYGTATAGSYGIATAGFYGITTAGDGGRLEIIYYKGDRYRKAVAYVGENGIKANVKYRLTEKGDFVKA